MVLGEVLGGVKVQPLKLSADAQQPLHATGVRAPSKVQSSKSSFLRLSGLRCRKFQLFIVLDQLHEFWCLCQLDHEDADFRWRVILAAGGPLFDHASTRTPTPASHSNYTSGVSPRAALEELGSPTAILCRSLPLALQCSPVPRFVSLASFAANLRVRSIRALQRKTPSFIVHPPTASAAQPATHSSTSSPNQLSIVPPSPGSSNHRPASPNACSPSPSPSPPSAELQRQALPFGRPLLLPEHVPLSSLQHASPAVASGGLLQF
ncbi:hypothetical protein PHYPSEUDO_011618 [Phytophthora pseudosyringae]|uniref:Uncharacterized protein n=1 Tax=Phytophthora pseudosyringae TaxID=221518 RepID=A0A8T1V8U8_9STRA|nr:hypothetical protein PHYPSEUDO_011618 [Phytophthora pseudosyringae]